MFLRDLLTPSHLFLLLGLFVLFFGGKKLPETRERAGRRNTVVQSFSQRDQQSGVAREAAPGTINWKIDRRLSPHRVGMNILLRGQETNFRPLLVEALKQAGHEWQFPATRESAVALIQQHTFDCVVLSYSLASGMIEEFMELLNQVCPCPIVAMSEQDDMDWKLQPTMIIRVDQDSDALIANLAMVERARLSPHRQEQAGASKSHKLIGRLVSERVESLERSHGIEMTWIHPRISSLFCYNLIHDAWTDASAIAPPSQDWIGFVSYSFLSIIPPAFSYAGWKWMKKGGIIVSKTKQANQGFPTNPLKTSWGRSSVG